MIPSKTIITVEIGECFNGDMDIARKLIVVAKDAGCDYVKFQTLDTEGIDEDDPEKDWFLKVALNENQLKELLEYSENVGINFSCTPENKNKAKILSELGLKGVKIASSSLIDHELLAYVNSNFERVFLSTGMGSLDEIYEAVKVLNNVKDLYILHCISEYPTGPLLEQRGLRALSHSDVRFNMMKMLMQLFPDYKIGYSDHTAGILAPVVAVAMGARAIEKHITLDRQTPIRNFETGGEYLGTDHVLSLEPDELKEMVKNIREVEKMFGPWNWERSEGERILRKFLRARFQPKLQSND